MLGGVAISWFSGVQNFSAAAVSESEYVALEEVVTELRFLRHVNSFVMRPMGYNVKKYEDNGEEIKMVNGGNF